MEASPASLLPLFPLPNVVLFPGVFLPLHIFEPRYRALIADVLAGDRRLGMVLLQPGWERDYEGRPPIFPIACSGLVVHAERLDDGRYNIVLRGLERVRVVEEDHERPYRRAKVEAMPDVPLDESMQNMLTSHRHRLDALLADLMERAGAQDSASSMPASSMSDAELVHALAQGLDLDPLEKQALLQHDSLSARAQSLVDAIEMKQWRERLPPQPGQMH